MKRDQTEAETRELLLQAAQGAREHAHAPHSHLTVGAAVLTDDGSFFTGCNIENASYGATVCAERVAIFSAVAAGHKVIRALAVTSSLPAPIAPCGLCRQVLNEFGPEAEVIMANTDGKRQVTTAKALLPFAFRFPD